MSKYLRKQTAKEAVKSNLFFKYIKWIIFITEVKDIFLQQFSTSGNCSKSLDVAMGCARLLHKKVQQICNGNNY